MSNVCNCDPWYLVMIQKIPSVVIVGILGVGGVIVNKFRDRIIEYLSYKIPIRNNAQTTIV